MESPPREYVVRNALSYAYDALRSKERFIGETTTSHYENYFQQLAERLGPPGKKWDVSISNSEVESFYLGRVTLGEFRLNTQKRCVHCAMLLRYGLSFFRLLCVHIVC